MINDEEEEGVEELEYFNKILNELDSNKGKYMQQIIKTVKK